RVAWLAEATTMPGCEQAVRDMVVTCLAHIADTPWVTDDWITEAAQRAVERVAEDRATWQVEHLAHASSTRRPTSVNFRAEGRLVADGRLSVGPTQSHDRRRRRLGCPAAPRSRLDPGERPDRHAAAR
ncbi:hypothetical protein, partial [Streptomyces adelaidensis]|uniref:hypothetical protein n=1 Tax=Streptomyces adelaidensis TaxID=2796465 RepID=UPI001F4044B8